MSCATDFEIRTLKAGTNGACEISSRGFGVEILSGGLFQASNVLQFGRSDSGVSQAFSNDNQLLCVPGNRLVATFDTLRLVSPSSSLFDEVSVKIITRPGVTWSDCDPSGKPRRIWLARTTTAQTLAAGVYVVALDTDVNFDRYRTLEHFDVCTFLGGWITGKKMFDVYVNVFNIQNPISTERTLARYSGADFSVAPAGSPQAVGYSLSLEGLTFPAGRVKIYVHNTDVASGTFEWLIGARG